MKATRVVAAFLVSCSWLMPLGGTAAGAPAAPDPSTSLYVTTASNNQLCNWGQDTAQKQLSGTIASDAFVILHFFAAKKFSGGGFGATRSSGPDQETQEIRQAAQRYGECWYEEGPGAGRTLKIAIGTTNDLLESAWAYEHGSAWAGMVERANDWSATQGYNAKLSFNGAMDAEAGWGPVGRVTSWARGYRDENTGWNYFYYGDAASCPSDKNPTWVCNWDTDDLIYVAWRIGVTTTFPQIYDEEPPAATPPTSVNAQQWSRLSKRSFNNGTGRINFAGGLSQKKACNEQSGCPGLELSAKDSWRDLWDEINCTYGGGNPCVQADDLRWTSVLSWSQGP